VDLCIVKPGAQIGVHEHLVDDEIYYILRGSAVMVSSGEARAVAPGDVVLLRCGGSHGLRNDSGEEVHVLVIDVLAAPDKEGRSFWRSLANVPLEARKSSVGGIGKIRVGEIFGSDELGPAWDFVQSVVVPPGCSIGAHEHVGTEEIYYFLAGRGVATVNDEQVAFGPNTVSLCPSGCRHGLVNESGQDFEFLAIQVPLAGNTSRHPAAAL
jgi:mannose-6-phosphate isomerase-like protein (cupin superfamily)